MPKLVLPSRTSALFLAFGEGQKTGGIFGETSPESGGFCSSSSSKNG